MRPLVRLAPMRDQIDKAALPYSTVTLLARFRGLSTSQPRATAMWYASSCKRDHRHHRLQEFFDGRNLDDVVGQLGRLRVALADHRDHRSAAGLDLLKVRHHLVVHLAVRQQNTLGVFSSTRAIGPCFISAAG